MKISKVIMGIIFLMTLGVNLFGFGTSSADMPIQGFLSDPSGTPVPDGLSRSIS